MCLFSLLYGSRPSPWHFPCKRSCCWSWVELPWCLLCCWSHPGNVPVCRSLWLRPSVETCRPSSSPYLWGSFPPRSPRQHLFFCQHGTVWTCTCRKEGVGQRSMPESHTQGNSREWPELPISTKRTHTPIQQTHKVNKTQFSALDRKDHSKQKKMPRKTNRLIQTKQSYIKQRQTALYQLTLPLQMTQYGCVVWRTSR